jgi:ribonuclease P protein component
LVVNVSELALEHLPDMLNPEGSAKFPRSTRLLRHSDFELVYKRGKRYFAADMTVFYLARAEGKGLRVGFTVGRFLGGAVERNRVKRRFREAFRLHSRELVAPVDVVINPKKSALKAPFSQLENEISRALEVIGKSIRQIAR